MKHVFRNKFPKILSLVLTLALVVSLCACSSTKTDPMKLSPKEHMLLVETAALNKAVDSITEAYSNSLKAYTGMGVEGEMSIRLGEDLLDMLADSMMMDDVSWLENINMGVEGSLKDDLYYAGVNLSLGNKNIATFKTFFDLAGQNFWLGIPTISNKYIMGDLDNILDVVPGSSSQVAIGSPMEMMGQLADCMPKADTLNALLDDYLLTAISQIDNVNRSEETLEQDGLKQDVVTLKYTISEEDCYKIAIAVLEKAKKDISLKKIIENMAEGISEISGEDIDGAELYESFSESVADALEELKETDEFDNETKIVVETYLDSSNAIIGRKVYLSGEDADSFPTMHFITVTEGNAYTTEGKLDVDGVVLTLTGSGTIKSGKTDGTYRLKMKQGGQTMKIADLELKDYKQSGKASSGKLKIDPSADMMEFLLSSSVSALADLGLEFSWDNDGVTNAVGIDILMNDELMLGLGISAKEVPAGDIKAPSNAYDMNDYYELEEWLSSLDLDILIDNLEAAGVPDVEEIFEALLGGY